MEYVIDRDVEYVIDRDVEFHFIQKVILIYIYPESVIKIFHLILKIIVQNTAGIISFIWNLDNKGSND